MLGFENSLMFEHLKKMLQKPRSGPLLCSEEVPKIVKLSDVTIGLDWLPLVSIL